MRNSPSLQNISIKPSICRDNGYWYVWYRNKYDIDFVKATSFFEIKRWANAVWRTYYAKVATH